MRILHPDSPWVGEDEVADGELVLAITYEDLAVLASGINEALEMVDDWEFQTRVGVTRDEARALRTRLGKLLRESYQPE